ncbi:MAG: P-loop NTPase [Candidatus Hydrogenedentes bacterium]|nr:P-loop NTPase [Candidatus Hydrogenedentota bacterium]
MTKETKTCDTCASDSCSASHRQSGETDEEFMDRQALMQRMCRIRHKVLVLSGKGGVGKSTVAVNLATALSLAGNRVGLLDVDIHGPSVPKLLGLETIHPEMGSDSIKPVVYSETLSVMSIGFLLQGRDDAVIWRGPMKHGVIKQFLKDVEWGDLDWLVVDAPPGTGDEPLSVVQMVNDADGAILVTTPQEIALIDVRKAVDFCRKLSLPVLGVIENMSGFVCPKCGEVTDVFGSGGGEKMASSLGVPFLGRIPIDPRVVVAGDTGKPYVQNYRQTETAGTFSRIMEFLEHGDKDNNPVESPAQSQKGDRQMKIAIPLAAGRLSMHFGHCEQFALVDVDSETNKIIHQEIVEAPMHQPGLLPRWLHEQNADVIIASGMGQRAQSLFEQNGIHVVVGAPSEPPEQIVAAYMNGTLKAGENICDH